MSLETKVSGCVHRRGKQKYRITKVGVKSKILTQNERISRHNQYIKTKSVKVPSDLKLKTALSRFVFKYFLSTSCDDSSAVTEFTLL